MNTPEIVAHGGYALIAVGTFFEGETVMLAAGVAASLGLLSLPLVMAASIAGIFGSDSVCFLIGRIAADRFARWFPKVYARLGGARRLVERHQDRLLIFYQFFPGLCAITPMAFGMTSISTRRFLALDLIGNVAWTLTFALAGYGCGEAIIPLVAHFPIWQLALAALAGVAVAVWAARRVGPAVLRRARAALG